MMDQLREDASRMKSVLTVARQGQTRDSAEGRWEGRRDGPLACAAANVGASTACPTLAASQAFFMIGLQYRTEGHR